MNNAEEIERLTTLKTKLLKISDACEILNVTESWLRRQIFLKAIPYKKVGRLIRFEEEVLFDWINKR